MPRWKLIMVPRRTGTPIFQSFWVKLIFEWTKKRARIFRLNSFQCAKPVKTCTAWGTQRDRRIISNYRHCWTNFIPIAVQHTISPHIHKMYPGFWRGKQQRERSDQILDGSPKTDVFLRVYSYMAYISRRFCDVSSRTQKTQSPTSWCYWKRFFLWL